MCCTRMLGWAAYMFGYTAPAPYDTEDYEVASSNSTTSLPSERIADHYSTPSGYNLRSRKPVSYSDESEESDDYDLSDSSDE